MSHDYGLCPHCHTDGGNSSGGICNVCGKSPDLYTEMETPPLRTRPRISPRPRMMEKLWVMGLSSNGFIPCGDRFQVTGRPQLVFQPEGLLIPHGIADMIVIDAIYVGQQLAMQVSTEALPGDLFKVRIEDLDKFDVLLSEASKQLVCIEVGQKAALLNGRPWHFPLMHPSMSIHITGSNVCNRPIVFRAGLVGTVPRHDPY